MQVFVSVFVEFATERTVTGRERKKKRVDEMKSMGVSREGE